MRVAPQEFPVAIPFTDALQSAFGNRAAVVSFMIDDAQFVGVPEDEWATLQLTRSEALRFRRHVRGRIAIHGVRHIVLAAEDGESGPSSPSLAAALTHRELQIARLIVIGAENKEIARELGISHFTVREHVRRIFHKLNVTKRSALGTILAGGGLADTAPA